MIVPDTDCEVCDGREGVTLTSSWLITEGMHACMICRALCAEPFEAAEAWGDSIHQFPWCLLTYIKNPRSGGGVYAYVGEVL